MSDLPPSTARPCRECPWVRTSTPGWLGPLTAEEWIRNAHGEAAIACHMTITEVDENGEGDWSHPQMRQCAGAAQFRTNIFKSPRNKQIVTAEERDTKTVFAWNDEFIEHHERITDE